MGKMGRPPKVSKTEKIDIITKRLAEGVDREEIAKELGIKSQCLTTFCKEYMIPLQPLAEVFIKKRKLAIQEYTDRGLSKDEIAKVFGLTVASLQEWSSRHRVPLPPRAMWVDQKRPGNVLIRASIPRDIAYKMVKEAEDRNLGLVPFTSGIISSVVEGSLYNAVLE